jgi:hypothetical protein
MTFVDRQDLGDEIASVWHEDSAIRHGGEGVQKSLTIVCDTVANGAEVANVDLYRNLRQRSLTCVVTSVGEIRQASGRRPQLATLAPETRRPGRRSISYFGPTGGKIRTILRATPRQNQ